jgi:REP element-mobilizing transposase RayT
MDKRKRVWYPGAQYHIMTRGNRRSDIFRSEEDFVVYLRILLAAKKKYPFYLYAYCLMDNHIHLQIETINVELWRIMHYINSVYSKYFNETYNLIGHLFQGRYYAECINTDAYMLQTNRYIHLNPVKAKMVRKPAEYEWSSYKSYISFVLMELVDNERFIQNFKDINAYIAFIEDTNIHISDLQIEILLEDD